MIKQRIKVPDKNSHNFITIGYMIADTLEEFDNKLVAIGVSVCHPLDRKQFDKAVGETLAYERLIAYNQSYTIKEFKFCSFEYYEFMETFTYIENQIHKFIKRCKRYYKGKSIITPNIIFK